jgi:D-sedoheptulose 7-phosphate isomerase
METFKKLVEQRIRLYQLIENSGYLEQLYKVSNRIIQTYISGNKILICGNGGSAADAQHWAAEIVGRYEIERKPLSAIALTVDTSALTAIANDYGFEEVFVRQLQGLGQPGDMLVGISTSGNSSNVVRAIEMANKMDIATLGMCGNAFGGGKLAEIADMVLVVPSKRTCLIQEVQEFSFHTICGEVERSLKERGLV